MWKRVAHFETRREPGPFFGESNAFHVEAGDGQRVIHRPASIGGIPSQLAKRPSRQSCLEKEQPALQIACPKEGGHALKSFRMQRANLTDAPNFSWNLSIRRLSKLRNIVTIWLIVTKS